MRRRKAKTDHSRVTTVPVSVSLEARGHGLHLAVGTFNLESVLEQDDVDFAFLELTLLLEESGESTHDGLSLSDGLGREETKLSALGSVDLVLVLWE